MYLTETPQQALVLVGVTLCGFTEGFIFGQMSGMLSALQNQQEEMSVTKEQLSWIASIINVTCFIGYIIGNVVIEKFGRKLSVTIFNVLIFMSWITVYLAQDIVVLLISRIMAGISFGGIIIATSICTSEYLPPSIRELSLCIANAIGSAAGTAVGHILGILVHWRTVALIGTIPTLLTFPITLFWVESPSILAASGKFEECETAFWKLRKRNESAFKELRLLIDLEKNKLNKTHEMKRGNAVLSNLWLAVHKKYFWKILALGATIAMYRASCGKIVFMTFAVTMLEDITGTTHILLFTVLIDSFIILGSLISCASLNKANLRTIIFPASYVGLFLLICLSVGLYFRGDNNSYIHWLNCLLMAVYHITITVSSSALENYNFEIYPLEIKPALWSLLAVVNGVFIFLSIKLFSVMSEAMGYHGYFMLNAALLAVCVIYLWKYLPEIKGRTLQEIELYFKTNSFDGAGQFLDKQESKELL